MVVGLKVVEKLRNKGHTCRTRTASSSGLIVTTLEADARAPYFTYMVIITVSAMDDSGANDMPRKSLHRSSSLHSIQGGYYLDSIRETRSTSASLPLQLRIIAAIHYSHTEYGCWQAVLCNQTIRPLTTKYVFKPL